ncbi:uncharacterized protein LOC111359080 [Spodoptera litura]|uniref:Uncharacterized protein LOC111359080 n=1 Tax=Spodoptera litura TaxID=69820 RepID=A0A9J7EGW3_SPOLT|nr:uncharacterized protein LOC111359080 [Spodoptera litura]
MKNFYLIFLVALIIINQSDEAKARQLRYLMLTRNGEETEKEHESTEAVKMYESTTQIDVDIQDNQAIQNLPKTKNGHKTQINTETQQSKQIPLNEFENLKVNEEVVTLSNVSNKQYEQPASVIQAVPIQEPDYHKKIFGQDLNHQKSYIQPTSTHRPQANNPLMFTRLNDVSFPHGRYDYNYNQGYPNIKPIAIPRGIYLQKGFGQQHMPPRGLIQPLLTEPIYSDHHIIERTCGSSSC